MKSKLMLLSQKCTDKTADEDTQKTAQNNTARTHLVRVAASKAAQKMKKWNQVLGRAPENV